MNKKKFIEMSKKEAFLRGVEDFNNGKSEEYNPYRNLEIDENIAELENAYLDGWNLSKKDSENL